MPALPRKCAIEWLSEFFPEGFVIFAKQKNGRYRTIQHRPPNAPDRFLAEAEIEVVSIEKRANAEVDSARAPWKEEDDED